MPAVKALARLHKRACLYESAGHQCHDFKSIVVSLYNAMFGVHRNRLCYK